MEFRLDVIEASTDKVMGTTVITTQGLLQEQRDILINKDGVSLLQFLKSPLTWTGMRKLKLELRAGIKQGGSDFFSAPKRRRAEDQDGETEETSKSNIELSQRTLEFISYQLSLCSFLCDSEAIIGWIEIEAGLEEFTDKLYGPGGFECPPKPASDLNMENFQVHISRLKLLVDDIKYAVAHYNYLVNWEDPIVTWVFFLAFLWFSLYFNAEYSGR